MEIKFKEVQLEDEIIVTFYCGSRTHGIVTKIQPNYLVLNDNEEISFSVACKIEKIIPDDISQFSVA